MGNKKNNKNKDKKITYQELAAITNPRQLDDFLRSIIKKLPAEEFVQLMLEVVKHANKVILVGLKRVGVNLDAILLVVVRKPSEFNLQSIQVVLEESRGAVVSAEFVKALSDVASNGNIALLECMFGSRDVSSQIFQSAVITAVEFGHIQALTHFWERMSRDRKSLQHYLGAAIQAGNFSLIEALLGQGMQLGELRQGCYSAFYYAALGNDYEMLSYFKSDATQQDLHYALTASIDGGHVNSLNYILLISGVDVNHLSGGMTPLLRAIKQKNKVMISRLINAGASLEAVGQTPSPLDYAITEKCPLLFSCLPDDELIKRHGSRLWRHAIESQAYEVLIELFQHYPAGLCQPVDDSLNTPLHCSILFKSQKSVLTLIELGADPFLLNAAGQSVLDLAWLSGDVTICDSVIPSIILQRHRKQYGNIAQIESFFHAANFYLIEALVSLLSHLSADVIDHFLPFVFKREAILIGDTIEPVLIDEATSALLERSAQLDQYLDRSGRGLLPDILNYLTISWDVLNVDAANISPMEALKILHALALHINSNDLASAYSQMNKRRQEVVIAVSKNNIQGYYLNKALACLWSRYAKMLLPVFARVDAGLSFNKQSGMQLTEFISMAKSVLAFVEFNEVMYDLYAFNKNKPPFAFVKANLDKVILAAESSLNHQIRRDRQALNKEAEQLRLAEKVVAQKNAQEAESERLRRLSEVYFQEKQREQAQLEQKNALIKLEKEKVAQQEAAARLKRVEADRLERKKADAVKLWSEKNKSVLFSEKQASVSAVLASSSAPVINDDCSYAVIEPQLAIDVYCLPRKKFALHADIKLVFDLLAPISGEFYAVGSSVIKMIREASQVSSINASDVDIVGFNVDVSELIDLGFYSSRVMPNLYKKVLNDIKLEIYISNDVSDDKLKNTMQARDFTICSMLCDMKGEVIALEDSYFEDAIQGRLKAIIPAAECFKSDPVRLIRAMSFVLKGMCLDESVASAMREWEVVSLSQDKRMHINLKVNSLLKDPSKRIVPLLMANGLLRKLFDIGEEDLARACALLSLKVSACTSREYQPSTSSGLFDTYYSSVVLSPEMNRKIR